MTDEQRTELQRLALAATCAEQRYIGEGLRNVFGLSSTERATILAQAAIYRAEASEARDVLEVYIASLGRLPRPKVLDHLSNAALTPSQSPPDA